MEKLAQFLIWGIGISAMIYPLIIEAIKKFAGEQLKIKPEHLALIVSIVLSLGVCGTAYVFEPSVYQEFNNLQKICAIAIFVFLSCICSQLGYVYVYKHIFGKNETAS